MVDGINKNKKRILIFSVAYLPFVGGAEVAVKELTDRLTDYDFDLVTVNLDGRQKKFETIGRVNVYRVGVSKIYKYTFPLSGFLKAWQLQKKNSYDATWSIMANYAGLAGLFFKYKFPEIPLVLTLQEGDPLPYIKRRMFWLYPLFKSLFKKADKITAISNYLADWAREMGARGEVVVVPNGVDLEVFNTQKLQSREDVRKDLKFGSNDTVLVTTSRLVEKNAIDDVIGSLTFLPSNVYLLVIGVDPVHDNPKWLDISERIGRRIRFLGFVSHDLLPFYLWVSDIFIRPSISEGFGNSFIEAMAAKIPVIATPVGGIVDFLKDGETGLFCRVNDPKSISEAVLKLINDPALRDKIIGNAFEMVSAKYDWQIVAKQMKVEVFDKIQ